MNAAAFSLFGVRMVSMRYPLTLLTVIQAGLMFEILKRGGAAMVSSDPPLLPCGGDIRRPRRHSSTSHWFG